MKNLNTKLIVFCLKITTIFVFSLVCLSSNNVLANSSFLQGPTYVSGHYNANGSYTFGDFVWNDYESTRNVNPAPEISSINPKYSNLNIGTKTITITGSGFTPNSIVRINDSNRSMTFIDPSHLLVQINNNDTNTYQNNGGFFITVFNTTPGGGYSNGVFFTLNNNLTSYNTGNSFTNTDQTDNTSVSSLVSNIISGSTGVYPSSIIQWLFFAMLVLVAVVLVRRIRSSREKYDATPLKHD